MLPGTGENITAKKKKKTLFSRVFEKWASYIYRNLREEFSDYDKSENVISGRDVRDYFGPKIIEMSKILPLAENIRDAYNQIDNVVIIGVERKGFALLGAMLDEIDSDDIKFHRNRTITKELVKDNNIILFDDACHTGKTIIEEVNRLKKLGAKEIVAYVILTTKNALEMIHKNHIEIFPRFICKEESYSMLYSAFYDMVNASVIPVTGEPYDAIAFQEDDIFSLPYILSSLNHGELNIIDSYDDSNPIRATIDYYKYVTNGGQNLFDDIGKRTGVFITELEQVKIRIFFNYKNEKIIMKLKPIIYLMIPQDFNCKKLEKCKEKGKPLSSVYCRDCIEKMFGEILVKDLKDEIDRIQ